MGNLVMSRTFKDRGGRAFRKGQNCPKCGDKNNKNSLDFCSCGCKARKNNNLYCKKCKKGYHMVDNCVSPLVKVD